MQKNDDRNLWNTFGRQVIFPAIVGLIMQRTILSYAHALGKLPNAAAIERQLKDYERYGGGDSWFCSLGKFGHISAAAGIAAACVTGIVTREKPQPQITDAALSGKVSAPTYSKNYQRE